MDDRRRAWRRSTRRAAGPIVGALAIAGWLVASGAARPDGQQGPATKPEYDGQGNLIAPRGFRCWIFAGADLSPVYGPAAPGPARRVRERDDSQGHGSFHNIYINPEAYRAFLDTGEFPDQTQLVMEVLRAETRDAKGILAGGEFEGKRSSVEVAVKDVHHPHEGVPWAYYAFDLDGRGRPSGPATASPKAACYDCHREHAGVDNVWVQFYPALRDPE